MAGLLAGDDAQQHFDVFAALTSRFDFNGTDGARVARGVLDTLGGEQVVHGHSIIGTLVDVPSAEVEGPLTYADGLVVAIDGGRYDGGPLLLVESADPTPAPSPAGVRGVPGGQRVVEREPRAALVGVLVALVAGARVDQVELDGPDVVRRRSRPSRVPAPERESGTG